MPDTYIVNPLSKETEPKETEPKESEPKESEHSKEEELDGGRDISLCFLSYFLCCLPIIMGSTG